MDTPRRTLDEILNRDEKISDEEWMRRQDAHAAKERREDYTVMGVYIAVVALLLWLSQSLAEYTLASIIALGVGGIVFLHANRKGLRGLPPFFGIIALAGAVAAIVAGIMWIYTIFIS